MSREIGRPILIAHRGDPAHAPENTVASFRSAVAHGAGAVEVDARRCSDGCWVVHHNPIRRRTPGIPTLEQVLAWCRRRRTSVYLDVKETSREEELLRLIRRSGWLGRTVVLAGSVPSLRRWRRLLPPRHPLFWVTGFHSSLTPRRISVARRLKLTGFTAYRGRLRAGLADRLHRAGLKLFVWTARSTGQIRRITRLGADGIMSEVWPPPRLI